MSTTDIFIETDRLLLKGISPATIHRLFSTLSPAEVKAFLGVDEKGFGFYSDMHEHGMETFRISAFFFLLVEKSTQLPLGECGFHNWNKTHRRAELYYLLRHDEHKRLGFMSEALPHTLSYGFNQMSLHRIEAKVAKDNTPSVRLLHKHGFTFEGTMREDYVVDGVNTDSDCYSLLKHEFPR